MGSIVYIPVNEMPLALDVQDLANQFVRLDVSEPSHVLACVVARSSLFERIRERQYDDPHLLVFRDIVRHGDVKQVTVVDDGVLRIQGCVCVPNVDGLSELILKEAHGFQYSIHLGAAKMLTRSAHFIPMAVTYSSKRLVEIFIREIVRLHGVPVSIISDQDTQFTSHLAGDTM
ncbi:uncharacterized protein [Nicotiana sylvestris]|uniref:uncharacterized protein n=1 Tax=Nicotiana sylvestris TaxID=4096 RepID=UPI00388CB8E5